jgi:teichuronic acid biosynthesis protein TuaF
MSVFKHVAERLRKHLWIVIALPILLGITGWLVPMGKMPSSFEAQTTIQLGSYGKDEYNDPNQVTIILSNAPFFEKHLQELWNEQQQALLSQLNISNLSNHLIQIRYRGKDADDAMAGVNAVTNAFLAEDQARFSQKEKIIDQAIESLKKEKTSESEAVERARFLYKLQLEKVNMKQAQLIEPAQKGSGTSVSALSSKKRAALGFMIGVTFSIIGAALPEFVRKKE